MKTWICLSASVDDLGDHILLKKIEDLHAINIYHSNCKVSITFKNDDNEYFLTKHDTLAELDENNNFIYEYIYKLIHSNNIIDADIIDADNVSYKELLETLFT